MQIPSLFPLKWKKILIAEQSPPKADLNISALSWYEVLTMRKEKAQPMSWQSAGQHHNYVGLLKSISIFLSEGMSALAAKVFIFFGFWFC